MTFLRNAWWSLVSASITYLAVTQTMVLVWIAAVAFLVGVLAIASVEIEIWLERRSGGGTDE